MKNTLTNRKNIAFAKLSKAQKRITIAADVISQLKRKKLVASDEDGYIHFRYGSELPEGASIKDNYDKVTNCNVCALGACLMSATKFANVLTTDDIGNKVEDLNNKNVKKVFGKIFSPYQLLLIESAYERGQYGGTRFSRNVLDAGLREDVNEKCEAFYDKYHSNPNARMIAIMKNIIKNNGTFKP